MSSLSMPLRRAIGAALAGGLCLVATACRDDSGGDSAAFCGEVEDHLDELRAIPQTEQDVESLIALWKEIGTDAPLSIEPDWQAHVLLYETVWDPEILTDDDKAEEAYARAFATERSSVAVAAWVNDNCGVNWGPVATIVPQVTTTTLAPGATPPTTVAGAVTTTVGG